MSQATLNGVLLDDGDEPCQCRFRYGLAPALGLFTPYVAGITTGTSISATVTELLPGRLYYFQAEAVNSAGTSLGAVLSFTMSVAPAPPPTPPPVKYLPPSLRTIPIVTTEAAQDIIRYVATLNGILDDHGGQQCSVGFEWGTDALNLSSSLVVGIGVSPLPFSVMLHSFFPSTTYYFRAFATNSAGTGYGAVESFTTQDALLPIPGPPVTPPGPPVTPPGILPPLTPPGILPPLIPGLPTPPIQLALNFMNIGLAIGGAAGAALIIASRKKKKEEEEAARSL